MNEAGHWILSGLFSLVRPAMRLEDQYESDRLIATYVTFLDQAAPPAQNADKPNAR